MIRIGDRATLQVRGRPLGGAIDGSLVVGEPVQFVCRDGQIIERGPPTTETGESMVGSSDAFLIPSLTDSHAHLMASASRRVRLDLGPALAPDLASLFDRLRRAVSGPGENWLVGAGFDEALLAEHRAPSLAELDAVVGPRAVRVRHATRHASLLSSTALARISAAGLTESIFPVEPGSALFFEREPSLTSLTGPPDGQELCSALADLSRDWLRNGIGRIEDLTASNDAGRVRWLGAQRREGRLAQSVAAWIGDADEFEPARTAAGEWIEIVGVKLLAHDEETVRSPRFLDAVARAHRRGLPVAIHAASPDVADAALDVLASATPVVAGNEGPPPRDRIEHAFLCPPALIDRLRRAAVRVVVQPAFLTARQEKYRHELEAVLWPWLQPLRSLLGAGVALAAGSDAPIGPGGVGPALRGGILRGGESGAPAIGGAEALGLAEALALWAHPFSAAAGLRAPALGEPADFTLLEVLPNEANGFRVEAAAVVVAGRRLL